MARQRSVVRTELPVLVALVGLAVLTVALPQPVRADAAAELAESLKRRIEDAALGVGEAGAHVLYGDREAAGVAIGLAGTACEEVLEAAGTEASAETLGKAAKKIVKGAAKALKTLGKAAIVLDDGAKSQRSALKVVLKAAKAVVKIEKALLKTGTVGPVLLLLPGKTKAFRPGMQVPLRVLTIEETGGASCVSPDVSVACRAPSFGAVVERGSVAAGSTGVTLRAGPDAGCAVVTVEACGRTARAFVLNQGALALGGKPKPIPTEATTVAPGEGWTVYSGLGGEVAGGEGAIEVSSEVPQLLFAADESGEVKLLGLHRPGEPETELTPESTATALAALHPVLARAYLDDPAAVAAAIEAQAEHATLADHIGAHRDEDVLDDPATGDLLAALVDAAAPVVLAARAKALELPIEIDPAEEVNGLRVDWAGTRGGITQLSVRNSSARWVSAYFDGLVPEERIGLSSGTLPASNDVSPLSPVPGTPTTTILDWPGDVEEGVVRGYGLGTDLAGIDLDRDLDRLLMPCVFTAIEGYFLPVFTVITGAKDMKGLLSWKKTQQFAGEWMSKGFIRTMGRELFEGKITKLAFFSGIGLELAKELHATDFALIEEFLWQFGAEVVKGAMIKLGTYLIPALGWAKLAYDIGEASLGLFWAVHGTAAASFVTEFGVKRADVFAATFTADYIDFTEAGAHGLDVDWYHVYCSAQTVEGDRTASCYLSFPTGPTGTDRDFDSLSGVEGEWYGRIDFGGRIYRATSKTPDDGDAGRYRISAAPTTAGGAMTIHLTGTLTDHETGAPFEVDVTVEGALR